MNYFERLIRRALLETPSRAGEVLRDPFENEEPLQLDSPVQKPASPWPERHAATSTKTPADTHVEVRTERQVERETQVIGTPVPSPSIAPQPMPAPDLANSVPVTHPQVTAPPATPLTRADSFMRSLGVAMPSFEAAEARALAAAAQPPSIPTPRVAAKREKPLDPLPRAIAARPQPMQPPSEPAVPVRSPAPFAKEHIPATVPVERERAKQHKQPQPPADKPIVRESIRIVKVVESQSGHASLLGAAPPTFGAGQL